MKTGFCLAIKLWHKELGQHINKSLENQGTSDQLKSVIVSNFMEEFQLSRESEFMQQFVVIHRPSNPYLNIYME